MHGGLLLLVDEVEKVKQEKVYKVNLDLYHMDKDTQLYISRSTASDANIA